MIFLPPKTTTTTHISKNTHFNAKTKIDKGQKMYGKGCPGETKTNNDAIAKATSSHGIDDSKTMPKPPALPPSTFHQNNRPSSAPPINSSMMESTATTLSNLLTVSIMVDKMSVTMTATNAATKWPVKVPAKTLSTSSLNGLDKKEDTVVAGDSKIATADIVTVNPNGSMLDKEESDDHLKGFRTTICKTARAVKNWRVTYQTIQAQLNMVTGQLNQLILTNRILLQHLGTKSNSPPSGDDVSRYDLFVDDDDEESNDYNY